MTEQLDRAVLELSTDDSQFNAGIDRAKAKAESLGGSFKKTAKDANDAGGTISNFFAKLVAGVASGDLLASALEKVGEGALEAVKSLPELVEQTMHAGANLATMAMQTGISVEGLSKLQFVSGQTGTNIETLTSSIFRMEANLGGVGAKGKAAQEAIADLHLNLSQLKAERPEEAFAQVLDALGKIPSVARMDADGMAIFGRSFKDIAQLAHENIGEIMKDAEDLGIVWSTDMAASAKAAEDALHGLESQVEMVGARIGAAFLPAVIGVSKDLQTLFKGAIDDANKSLDAMGKPGGGFLATVAAAMGTGDGAIVAQTELYNDLRDAIITLVRGGLEPLITAIGFIGKEWDAALVLANMIVVGYQGITYAVEGVLLAFAEMAKYTDPFGFSKAKQNIEFLKGDIDRLYTSMAVGQQKIDDYKKSEQDWDKTAAEVNAHIEAGLNKVGQTHVDVAGIIKKVHDVIDAATQGTRKGVDDETASLDKLDKNSPEYQHALELLALAHKHLADEAKLAAKEQEANFKAFGDYAAHAPTAIFQTRDLSGVVPMIDVGAVQAASNQRAILDATFDHIETRMNEQRVFTQKVLDDEARSAAKDYDDMRRSGLYTSDELQAAWQKMVDAQIASTGGLKQAYLIFLSELPKQLSDTFAKMILHTEGFKDGFKSIWQSIVGDIENILSNFINKFLSNLLGGVISKLAGLGGSIGSAIAGGIGGGQGGGGVLGGAVGYGARALIPGLVGGGAAAAATSAAAPAAFEAAGALGFGGGIGAGSASAAASTTGMFAGLGASFATAGITMGITAAAMGVTALIKHFTSTAGRDAVNSYVSQNFGTTSAGTPDYDALHKRLNDLHDQLAAVGYDSEELWRKLTQGNRGDAKAAAAAIKEVTDALAKAGPTMAEQAEAAGYQTTAELQTAADNAVKLWQYMKDSGVYTAAEVDDAWQKALDAMSAAGDKQGQAAEDAKKKIADLDSQIQSLQQSVDAEAPEEEMGVIEQQQRKQLDDLQKQRATAQDEYDKLAEHIGQSIADAVKDGLKGPFDLQVTGHVRYSNDTEGPTPPNDTAGPSAPDFTPPDTDTTIPDGAHPGGVHHMALGGIGHVDQPTLFLAGEAGPEDFAFSGGGRSFNDDSTTQPQVVLQITNEIYAIDGASVQRVVEGKPFAESILRAVSRNLNGLGALANG